MLLKNKFLLGGCCIALSSFFLILHTISILFVLLSGILTIIGAIQLYSLVVKLK